MALGFLKSKNRVRDSSSARNNMNSTNNHRRLCRCRSCRKKRGKDMKIACMFLFPLFGVMVLLALIA